MSNLLNAASLVVTPNSYKEGKLYSVIPNTGAGDFTFTRATTATRVNSDGLVELVPYNLVQYSDDFFGWSLLNSSRTTGQNNPFGSNDAIKLKYNTTNGAHYIWRGAPSIGQVTISIYAKASELNFLQIASAQTTEEYANFNLSTGVVGTKGTRCSSSLIENVGDGWYRCTATLINGTNSVYFGIVNSASSSWFGSSGYAGANNTDGLLLWGAQLVEGTNALPYQPTLDRLDRVRLDYSINGEPNILLEPQRTNLQPQSNGFLSDWSKEDLITSIGESTLISGQSTTLVTETAINAVHRFVPFSPVTLLIGTVYTISFYAKSNGTRNIGIRTGITGTNQNVIFNPNTQTTVSIPVGFTTKITAANNGYYRYEITATSAVLSDSCNIVMFNGTLISYLGTSESFYVSAFQYEAGSYATSYIPTTTATVTRNADQMTRNNIYTNGLITAAGGTWFVEVRNNRVLTRDAGAFSLFIGDLSASPNNGLILRSTLSTSTRLSISKRISTTETTLYTTLNDTVKIAIKWNGATADVFVNGVKQVSETAFTATNMEFLNCFATDVPKYINSMVLYPTPLPDSKCIELTGGGFDTPELAYASIGVTSESPTYLNQSVNSLIF